MLDAMASVAYGVSKRYLGRPAALVAGASLIVDYVLNVAVSVAAGVAALTSAFPELHRYTLELCLGVPTAAAAQATSLHAARPRRQPGASGHLDRGC